MTEQEIIEAIEAVKAVQTVQEQQNVLRKSMFTENDVWKYHAVSDGKLCIRCEMFSEIGEFIGSNLNAIFPDMDIISENEIMVNNHINCRCYLTKTLETSMDRLT